jgi:hypothetical protein
MGSLPIGRANRLEVADHFAATLSVPSRLCQHGRARGRRCLFRGPIVDDYLLSLRRPRVVLTTFLV